MSKSLEIYKDARKKGKNEYEALGIAASYIAKQGTFKDLLEVDSYCLEDMLEETRKLFDQHVEKEKKEYANVI